MNDFCWAFENITHRIDAIITKRQKYDKRKTWESECLCCLHLHVAPAALHVLLRIPVLEAAEMYF